MSTEEPTVEDLEVAAQEAELEATEAQQLLDAIVERLTTGDDDVTIEDLQSAKKVATFARLRAEGARNKLAAAREAAREHLLNDLDNAVAAALAPGKPLHPGTEVAALTAFTTAVRTAAAAYLAHREAMQSAVSAIAAQAEPLALTPGTPGSVDGPPADTPFAQRGARVYTPAGVVGESRHERFPSQERKRLERAARDAVSEVYR